VTSVVSQEHVPSSLSIPRKEENRSRIGRPRSKEVQRTRRAPLNLAQKKKGKGRGEGGTPCREDPFPRGKRGQNRVVQTPFGPIACTGRRKNRKQGWRDHLLQINTSQHLFSFSEEKRDAALPSDSLSICSEKKGESSGTKGSDQKKGGLGGGEAGEGKLKRFLSKGKGVPMLPRLGKRPSSKLFLQRK